MGHRSQAFLNHSFNFVKCLIKWLFDYKNNLFWENEKSFYSFMDLWHFSVLEYAGFDDRNVWCSRKLKIDGNELSYFSVKVLGMVQSSTLFLENIHTLRMLSLSHSLIPVHMKLLNCLFPGLFCPLPSVLTLWLPFLHSLENSLAGSWNMTVQERKLLMTSP